MRAFARTRPDGGVSITYFHDEEYIRKTLDFFKSIYPISMIEEKQKKDLSKIARDLSNKFPNQGEINRLYILRLFAYIEVVGDYLKDGSATEFLNSKIKEFIECNIDEVIEQKRKEVYCKAGINDSDCKLVEMKDIPQDRCFRNSWILFEGIIEEDISKCKEIQKKKIDDLSLPKINAIVMDAARYSILGDEEKTKKLGANAQRIKNGIAMAKSAIDSCKTPLEIKAIWPAEVDRE